MWSVTAPTLASRLHLSGPGRKVATPTYSQMARANLTRCAPTSRLAPLWRRRSGAVKGSAHSDPIPTPRAPRLFERQPSHNRCNHRRDRCNQQSCGAPVCTSIASFGSAGKSIMMLLPDDHHAFMGRMARRRVHRHQPLGVLAVNSRLLSLCRPKRRNSVRTSLLISW